MHTFVRVLRLSPLWSRVRYLRLAAYTLRQSMYSNTVDWEVVHLLSTSNSSSSSVSRLVATGLRLIIPLSLPGPRATISSSTTFSSVHIGYFLLSSDHYIISGEVIGFRLFRAIFKVQCTTNKHTIRNVLPKTTQFSSQQHY